MAKQNNNSEINALNLGNRLDQLISTSNGNHNNTGGFGGLPNPDDPRYLAEHQKERLQQAAQAQPLTAQDKIGSINDYLDDLGNKSIDPYKMAKVMPFGADINNHAFERYYNHPDFDELGFSPFRDNETLYNENSSFIDEMRRAGTQFMNLASLGFRDAMAWGSLTDNDTAKRYEKAVAIGNSTKGGVGGFTSNLFLNSGYTVGIMSELVAEEAVMALAGPVTGGGSWALGAYKLERAGEKIWKGGKLTAKMAKMLDNLKDVQKAKAMFKHAGGKVGDFLNPLTETTEFLRNYDKLEGLSGMAKTATGFGSFYRDTRNIRLAWGEAGLEGGMVENEVTDELIREHHEKYGNRPLTPEEAENIRKTAKAAGVTTAWQNLGAIFYSNKIVFDKMFDTFSPMRRLGEDILVKNAAGKVVLNRNTGLHEIVQKNLKGLWKTAKSPRAYARGGLNYFKANLAEGFQETAQEVIAGAAKDYYLDQFKPDSTRGGYFASIADNLQKQVSGQGFETFMSGFLMGGLVQGPQKLVSHISKDVYSKLKDPQGYAETKAAQEEYLNKTVNILNDLYTKSKDFLAPDLQNLTNQKKYAKGMDQAKANGDAKSFYDMKFASQNEHLWTALEMGRLESFTENLNDLKTLSEEDIQETYNLSQSEFHEAVDNAIDRANKMQQRYDMVKKKYASPFNPKKFRAGTAERIKETGDHAGWVEAQKMMVFMQDSFDNALGRMDSILQEAKADTGLAKANLSDINTLFSFVTLDEEMTTLKKEIDSLKDVTNPEQVKFRKQKEKKFQLLSDFADAMQGVMESTGDPNVDETSNEGDIETDSKAIDKAFKAYKNYMGHIAKSNNDYMFDEAIEKSFSKLIDYYNLDADSKQMTTFINTLTNPGQFTRQAERNAEVANQIIANKKAEIEASLKEWLKVKNTNDMLQLLHDEGIFFDPKQLDALLKDGKLPDVFYDADTKSVINDPEKINKALNIIKRHVDNLMDIPIPEAERGKNAYSSESRDKFEDDERTYEDLAKQFGFDSDAASSEVPLRQVLQAIIDSGYATAREAALAQRLINLASPEEKVTFVRNLEVPGRYSSVEQTKIDARYNSHDYRGGRTGHPIEHVILHEEIHRRTVEGLKDDAEFNGKINDLRERAIQYMERPDIKKQYGEKIPYGLSSNEEFVAEAMSNDTFKEFLAQIPGTVTGKTTWQNFVNTVMEYIRKVIGRDSDGTALLEALNIITAKIDQVYGEFAEEGKPIPEAGVGMAVTTTTPIAEIIDKHEDLAATLLEAYKETERNPDLPVLNENWEQLTDEEIYETPAFKTFVESFTAAREAIDQYNEDKGLSEAPPVVEEEVLPEGFRYVEEGEAISQDYVVRMSADGNRQITNAPKAEAKPAEVAVGPIKKEFRGKIIYGTPGIGKTVAAGLSEDIVDADDLMVEEIERSGYRAKRDNEAVQDYIHDFSFDAQGQTMSKDELNALVLGRMKELAAQGKTVLTGTPKLAASADYVVTGSAKHPGVIERLGDAVDRVKQAENEALEDVGSDKLIALANDARIQGLLFDEAGGAPPIEDIISRDMRRQLKELGYDEKEINTFRPIEARALITDNLTKAQRLARQAAAEQASKRSQMDAKERIRQEIKDRIDAVEDPAELDITKLAIMQDFIFDFETRRLGELTPEFIDQLIEQKKAEMALDFDFDDLVVGETVVLNNAQESKFVITGKTKRQVQGHYLNDDSKKLRKINKKDAKERIKYKYKEGMENYVKKAEPISEDAQELSNETTEVAQNSNTFNDPQSIKEDMEAGKKSDPNDLLSNILDNANTCK